ncbi:chloride channel protein [Lactobacillus corticis]|uniref:Chloride channel protein n=1 Tax=Lactobacillus corticis TaxID=2201249 RepID=A0A916QJM3_9LACO|nr:chloride channel protein [Lactobacillus corticis]GFZ26515.1 chloride channel protein [Lactobacillus corticis]
MLKYKLNHAIYIIFFSIVLGFATAGYLDLVNRLIELMWTSFPETAGLSAKWLPILLCPLFGIVIGLFNNKLGDYPLTIAETLAEVKKTNHFAYQNWWKTMLLGLLALTGGGSIGPEASTTVLLTGMIVWLGDRIKRMDLHQQELATMPFLSQLKFIWLGRLDKAELAAARHVYDIYGGKKVAKVLYTLLTAIGFVGYFGYGKLFPEDNPLGIHHAHYVYHWENLWMVIPAIIVGIIVGKLFIQAGKLAGRVSERLTNRIVKAIIMGIILAICGVITRDALFSGEFRIESLAKTAFNMSPWVLLGIALIKAFTTNFGFYFGWRGGTIFPAIICSFAIAAILAQYLPGNAAIVAAVVVASSLTAILGRPVLTAIVMLLLWPIELAIPILLVCWCTQKILQGSSYLMTKATQR